MVVALRNVARKCGVDIALLLRKWEIWAHRVRRYRTPPRDRKYVGEQLPGATTSL
jgi:hypothetical protein